MEQKTLGYILLIPGLTLLLLSLASVYQVFTGHSQPAALFNQPSVTFDPRLLFSAQSQLPSSGQDATIELISGRTLSQMFNLTAHIVLMSFVSGIGARLAGLGVQFLRPISLKLRPDQPRSK